MARQASPEIEKEEPTSEWRKKHPAARRVMEWNSETGRNVYHWRDDVKTEIAKRLLKGDIDLEEFIAGNIFADQYLKCSVGPGYATASSDRVSGVTHNDMNGNPDMVRQYSEARKIFRGARLSILINVVGRDDMSVSSWWKHWNRTRPAGQRKYHYDDAKELLKGVLAGLQQHYGVRERKR